MDFSKQFSITDFLAYFFPGAFATVGIYLFLLLTPVQKNIGVLSFDFITGIAFLVLSYIVGVVLSGVSGGLVRTIEKMTKYKNPHSILLDELFPNEVIKQYKKIMNISKSDEFHWTGNHYRLCRSFVIQTMPAIAQRVERQANLGLFRRNLVVPLLVWMLTGLNLGTQNISKGMVKEGIVVIILSFLISWLSIGTTMSRLHNNNYLEVREALLGFLVGCNLGLFVKPAKTPTP